MAKFKRRFQMLFFGILIGVVLFGGILYLLLASKDGVFEGGEQEGTPGNLTNLPEYLSSLITASSADGEPNDDIFLIGIVTETDDFLQFTSDENTVCMDFPLLTERQKSYEEKLKGVCTQLGVLPADYIHPNTSEIGTAYGEDRLAYHFSGSPEKISATIAVIYINLFEIDSETEMNFVTNGF